MAAIVVNPRGPQHTLVDLTAQMAGLSGKDHGPHGRIAQPIVSLPGLRVVLMSMKAGARWSEHSTPGRITVQPLTGEVRMHWLGQEAALAPGRLFALASNVPHDVVAETDAVFLLTVARPNAD